MSFLFLTVGLLDFLRHRNAGYNDVDGRLGLWLA